MTTTTSSTIPHWLVAYCIFVSLLWLSSAIGFCLTFFFLFSFLMSFSLSFSHYILTLPIVVVWPFVHSFSYIHLVGSSFVFICARVLKLSNTRKISPLGSLFVDPYKKQPWVLCCLFHRFMCVSVRGGLFFQFHIFSFLFCLLFYFSLGVAEGILMLPYRPKPPPCLLNGFSARENVELAYIRNDMIPKTRSYI